MEGWERGHRPGDAGQAWQGQQAPGGWTSPAPRTYGQPAVHHGRPPSSGYAGGGGRAAQAWRPPRPLADWGQRLAASLIDSLVVAVVELPGLVLLSAGLFWLVRTAVDSVNSTGDADAVASAVVSRPGWVVAAVVLGSIYVSLVTIASLWYFGWHQGLTGTTVGKGAMRIRLVDESDARPIGGPRALGRYLIRLVLSSTVVWIVSALWPLWDRKAQTWEDIAVKSIVVRDEPRL